NKITTEEQLDSLFQDSYDRPVALIKHSDTCGISSDIMDQLGSVEAEINVIVIQQNRDLSNSVAVRIEHRHQSPQAFVIKDGKAIYHATHYGISPAEIENQLK
ncbi:MAG: bacillithiol system redox-active protein YtxJ, partial [Pyrinomonadaceae bacterium]